MGKVKVKEMKVSPPVAKSNKRRSRP